MLDPEGVKVRTCADTASTSDGFHEVEIVKVGNPSYDDVSGSVDDVGMLGSQRRASRLSVGARLLGNSRSRVSDAPEHAHPVIAVESTMSQI